MAAEEAEVTQPAAEPAVAKEEEAAAPPPPAAPPAEESEPKSELKSEPKEEEAAPAAKAATTKPKLSKEDVEKKALEEFKLKVEEAIKANEFVLPPPPPPPKEEEKEEEAPKTEEATEKKDDAAEAPKEGSEAPIKEEEKKEEEAAAAVAAAPVESAEAGTSTAEEPKAPECEEEAKPVEDVYLWGIPLLHTKGDERTDVILAKFLKARDFEVNQALAMLKNTILWRKSFKTDEILDEDLSGEFDGLAFMYGEDKEGHPVCYNVFSALHDKELYHKVFGNDAAKFIRWRIQLQEKGIKLLDFQPKKPNALLQVIDFKNAPWPSKKVRNVILRQAITLLQDNYPELVIKIVCINVPWYYSAIFSLISPFLTQHQKNKFVVSRLGKSAESLFKFISPEKVPVQYGGLGKADDKDFSGAEAPVTELGIKAGEKKTIDLAVTTSGATVVWDMAILGSDVVSLSAEYQPDQEGGYTTIIEKPKKLTAPLEEPIRNSFKTSEPGKVVLCIDNSASRKKKTLLYRYIVKGSSTTDVAAAELDA